MKNKGIVNLIIFMILIIFFLLAYYFKYNNSDINEKIQNVKWYKYDYNTGYYETFYVSNNDFMYNLANKTNEYASCKQYSFNKNNNTLNLDCNKKIKIISVNKNYIVLNIDNEEKYFYDNIEDSLNYEFKSYFNKSISEFKKEKQQVKEYLKIDYEKLLEILAKEEDYRIVFMGDSCTSIECTLMLDIMEKWLVSYDSVYYIDANILNDNMIKNLYNLNNVFDNNINFYNGIYPRVVSNINENLNQYEVKCNGFNCTKFYKIEE